MGLLKVKSQEQKRLISTLGIVKKESVNLKIGQ
jgi:hypothetical protein